MTKYVLSGSSSKTCKTLNFICYNYGILNKSTISELSILNIKDIHTDSDLRTAVLIPDFINLRSAAVHDTSISYIIEDLCTYVTTDRKTWLEAPPPHNNGNNNSASASLAMWLWL